MSKLRWTAIFVMAVGLLLFSACQLARRAPWISISPTEVQPGTMVRISGQNWRPGERVTIGLNLPNARSEDSKTVTAALADASGSFVALFSFPNDERWSHTAEMQVVAHTSDFDKVALASIRYVQPVSMTPSPLPIVLATPTKQPPPTVAPTKPALFWRGEYYNNTTFSGNPVLIHEDAAIDFQWGDAAAAAGLPADNFTVRWAGTWPFETGAYRLYAQVDDGVRLWLDEHLIIDQWHESIGALYSSDVYLSAGSHAVKVEYFDGRDGAQAKVWWEYRGLDAAQTYMDWKGEYYTNVSLSGTPFLVVNDRLLDFDWGTGVPASGMPNDNFSVRWTRVLNLGAGRYRFRARSDDGVRLWIDGTLVIDHWQDGAAETYFGDLYLSSGNHSVRIEYYEHSGQAVIQVGWELLPNTPTPTNTPTQTPILPIATPAQTPTNTPVLYFPTIVPKPTFIPAITPILIPVPSPPVTSVVYLPLTFASAITMRRHQLAAHKHWRGIVVGW